MEVDIPQATKWNFSVEVLRGMPLMEIPLSRKRVFRKRLKTCFQSKSDVISFFPHLVLKNSIEERAKCSLLEG